MIPKKEPYSTGYIKIWMKDGVVHTSYPPGLVITLDIAKQILEVENAIGL